MNNHKTQDFLKATKIAPKGIPQGFMIQRDAWREYWRYTMPMRWPFRWWDDSPPTGRSGSSTNNHPRRLV